MIFSRRWLEEEYLDLGGISDSSLISLLADRGLSLTIDRKDRDDTIFSLEIPENRQDLNCLQGIAREISASLLKEVKPEPDPVDLEEDSIYNRLDVDVPSESCRRFTLRMAVNCRVSPSPLKLKNRMELLGLPSQNNLLDLCSCVSYETGQPLKILDAGLLPDGGFLIRDSFPGEEIPLPGGGSFLAEGGEPVLSDSDYQPIGAAGIAESRILEGCTQALILCGDFAPEALKNLTDRPEAFLCPDPLGTLPAVNRLCRKIQEYSFGQIVSGTLDSLNYIPQPRELPGCLPAEAERAMALLGFSARDGQTTLPSWRKDLISPEDLQKEIRRNLPK